MDVLVSVKLIRSVASYTDFLSKCDLFPEGWLAAFCRIYLRSKDITAQFEM